VKTSNSITGIFPIPHKPVDYYSLYAIFLVERNVVYNQERQRDVQIKHQFPYSVTIPVLEEDRETQDLRTEEFVLLIHLGAPQTISGGDRSVPIGMEQQQYSDYLTRYSQLA
jgi:hypothetical protein